MLMINDSFWRNKKVFVTGHTGFKGGWLSFWLASMGAKLTGYSLPPTTSPNLFEVAHLEGLFERSIFGDIRNLNDLSNALSEASPEIVFHMAAQPLVRYSYANPIETYETNVMGTANLLEAVRKVPSVLSVVVVTTDKCYENKEWVWPYRESDPMGGYDPYSSSKGCAELVTAAYRQSFFGNKPGTNLVGIATARAGNVIGGGDWSEDRLVPDAIRAFESNQTLLIRNPNAVRPWQHVIDPVAGYLKLAQALVEKPAEFSEGWNFGPPNLDTRSVRDVIDLLVSNWGGSAKWESDGSTHPHEANLLKLDVSKASAFLGWSAQWGLEETVISIVDWQKALQTQKDMRAVLQSQIERHY